MKATPEPTPSVTSRPKTGCPYIRVLQKVADAKGSTADTVTKKDLAPLRGVSDGVYRFLFSVAPHNPPNTGLDLDTISKQRYGGVIEHPGSLGCSPEHVVDGSVRPPRKDSARLPLLLQLLRQGGDPDGVDPKLLTHADFARLSLLALDVDEQFFVAKYGKASAMDADWSLKNVFPVGEAELAYAHLADDAGNVKTKDLLDLVGQDQLSTAAERAGGKASLPVLVGRLVAGLATRAAMPYTDAKYKKALQALKAAAAKEGGSLLDLDTGLVRRR